MLKQTISILALIAISILIILFMPYAKMGVDGILAAHNWVADVLKDVFSAGHAGDVSRNLLALLAIPFAIGLIPVIIYWLTRHSWFPYFLQVVWVIWLIQTAALIIQYNKVVI